MADKWICVFAFNPLFVRFFFILPQNECFTRLHFSNLPAVQVHIIISSMGKKTSKKFTWKKYFRTEACASAIDCVYFYSCSYSPIRHSSSRITAPLLLYGSSIYAALIARVSIHSNIKWWNGDESMSRTVCIEQKFISCCDWSFKQTKNDWFLLIRNSLRPRLLTHFLLLFPFFHPLIRSLAHSPTLFFLAHINNNYDLLNVLVKGLTRLKLRWKINIL